MSVVESSEVRLMNSTLSFCLTGPGLQKTFHINKMVRCSDLLGKRHLNKCTHTVENQCHKSRSCTFASLTGLDVKCLLWAVIAKSVLEPSLPEDRLNWHVQYSLKAIMYCPPLLAFKDSPLLPAMKTLWMEGEGGVPAAKLTLLRCLSSCYKGFSHSELCCLEPHRLRALRASAKSRTAGEFKSLYPPRAAWTRHGHMRDTWMII